MQKRNEMGKTWGEMFEETPIFMLRFIRYAAECGDTLEEEIKDAILEKSSLLAGVKIEEVEEELRKILVSEHPDVLREAYDLGLTKHFLPEFDRMMETSQNNPHHLYSVGEHTLHALPQIPAHSILRYTMLLHDIGKPMTKTTDTQKIDHFYDHYEASREVAEEVLRRLKLDEDSIRVITALIEWHDYRWEAPGYVGKNHIRKMMGIIGKDLILPLIFVQRADILAQSSFHQQEKLAILDQVESIYYEVIAADESMDMRELQINGSQLMQLGIRDMKKIGKILQILFLMVIEEPKLNERWVLQELAVQVDKIL